MSQVTTPSQFNNPADGYIVIAPFSEDDRRNLGSIQDQIADGVGRSNLWLPSGDQLHVTFAHLISPDATYATSTANLYEQLGGRAIEVLGDIVPDSLKTDVTFDQIKVFPSAIIVEGHDDAADVNSYERLRKRFVENFGELPDATRRPPKIIHTTIARFQKELDLDAVRAVVDGLSTRFVSQTTELQLIHETKIYVQAHDVIARFPERHA